mgnify:CR=1 FL=1
MYEVLVVLTTQKTSLPQKNPMKRASALLFALCVSSVFAQDNEDVYILSPFEILEAGSSLPAVTLKKRADNLLLEVTLVNDSRDETMRSGEILKTLTGMIEDAKKIDNLKIIFERKTITLSNLGDVTITSYSSRSDTSSCELLLKLPLKADQDADVVVDKLQKFAKNVKVDGRTIVSAGDIGLSVENPEQYRRKILGMIAEDYKFLLNTFDNRFQILVHNLNGRVQWQRSSISDLDLYIGYEYEVLAPDTQSLNVKTNEDY